MGYELESLLRPNGNMRYQLVLKDGAGSVIVEVRESRGPYHDRRNQPHFMLYKGSGDTADTPYRIEHHTDEAQKAMHNELVQLAHNRGWKFRDKSNFGRGKR